MEIQFRLFGIPIHVSAFFLLSAVVLGRMGSSDSPVQLAAWIVVMFVGVLLHELGHALTAQAFGQEPAVSLHGFGGVTVWQPRGGLGPGRRAVITLAGPMVGIVIGLPALVAGALIPKGTLTREILGYVTTVNLGWAMLNLLPMLPLDGGRIVASLLEMAFGKGSLRAAYIVSIGVAVVIGLLMLWAGMYLGLVFCAYFAYLNVQGLRELNRPVPPVLEP